MTDAPRQISIGLLCSIYLAVSLAGLVGTMWLPAISPGPKTFAAAPAGSKEKPKLVWVQRRHLPLVKTVPIPTETACTVEFPSVVDNPFIVPRYTHRDTFLSCYFSSVGDRAPPVA